jgi:hypothetical protein
MILYLPLFTVFTSLLVINRQLNFTFHIKEISDAAENVLFLRFIFLFCAQASDMW